MFFSTGVLTSGHETDALEPSSIPISVNPALFDVTSLFLEDRTDELQQDLEELKLDDTSFPLSKSGNKTMKQLLKQRHDGLQNVIKFSILKPYKEFKNTEILDRIKDIGYVTAVSRYNDLLGKMKDTYVPMFEGLLIKSLETVLPKSPPPTSNVELDICFHWSIIVMWVCAKLEQLFKNSCIPKISNNMELMNSIDSFKIYYETFLYEKNHKLSKSKATILFQKFKSDLNAKSFPTLEQLESHMGTKMGITDPSAWEDILHDFLKSELAKVADTTNMIKELLEFNDAVKPIAILVNPANKRTFTWSNGLPVLSTKSRTPKATARAEKSKIIVTDILTNQIAPSVKAKPSNSESISLAGVGGKPVKKG